jgi:hypothetical protein
MLLEVMNTFIGIETPDLIVPVVQFTLKFTFAVKSSEQLARKVPDGSHFIAFTSSWCVLHVFDGIGILPDDLGTV